MLSDPLMRDAEVMWLPPDRPRRQLPRMGVTKRHHTDESKRIHPSVLAISLHMWWLVSLASDTETREVEIVVTPYAHDNGRRTPDDWTGYTLAMPVQDFLRYVI